MSPKFIIALAAGIGGIAPSLTHLAQGFIKTNPDVPGVFYFIGIAIFFILGALVAFFFAETEARKAFFLGIGLPALITTAQTEGAVAKSASFDIIPAAYAQTTPLDPTTISQKLSFKPVTECKDCEVWFADSNGKLISKHVLNVPAGLATIAVPHGASQLGVFDPKSNLKLMPVPEKSGSPVTVEFRREYSPLNDLRRGLGNYDLKSYDANITIKQH